MLTRGMHAALVMSVMGAATSLHAAPASSGPTALRPAQQTPRCFDQDYASLRRGAVGSRAVPTPGGADNASSLVVDDGTIVSSSRPLPEPPEISRVQRGLVEHFVGAHLNEGLESWSGIDLDRGILISVQRRVYDVHAANTHPFADPKLPAAPRSGHIFARKYSDEQRTELEVVSTIGIDPPALQAFVCVANAGWAQAAAANSAIADGLQNARLLDVESEGGRELQLSKPVSFVGPLGFVFSGIERFLPHPSW